MQEPGGAALPDPHRQDVLEKSPDDLQRVLA
jgi:hypothetical protein